MTTGYNELTQLLLLYFQYLEKHIVCTFNHMTAIAVVEAVTAIFARKSTKSPTLFIAATLRAFDTMIDNA